MSDKVGNGLTGGPGGNSGGTGEAHLADLKEGSGAISGNPAASGDMDAGRGEATDDDAPAAAGSGGGDAGSPGGMGGVRGGMPNPDHRPNGGVSPMQGDKFRGDS